MMNANYTDGILTFEENCPKNSPAYIGCGDRITIRKPGTVAGSYAEFEVISADGEDRLAIEVGSRIYAAWLAGTWSPPVGRPVTFLAAQLRGTR